MRPLPRLIAGATVLLCAWQLVHASRAAWSEYSDLRPRRTTVPMPPDAGYLNLTDVRFVARTGTTIAGWYIPSRNGAVVILCTGTGSDRTALLDRARQLAIGHFGVLLFDWPGYGESGGVVRLGAPERAALAAAIDFVAGRPDIDQQRIGLLCFSQGTVYATLAAASDRRIRAVLLEGAFGDFDAQVRAEYARGGPLGSWAADLGSRLGGIEPQNTHPDEVIAAIAPRPVAIVAGSGDVTVPPRLSRALYERARPPKQYWVIHGADHGGYSRADATYGARVRAFFTAALLDHPAPR